MPEVTKYQIGNTTVRVFDDACKSQAEVEEILRRISRLLNLVSSQPARPTQAEATRRPTQRP